MGTASDGIRVLHVDDEPGLAEMVAEFLRRQDDCFQVETAETVREGLDRVGDDEFDCIVSDYDMPGQNGIEFLDAVRDQAPDLPFILYTGKGSEAVAEDAIAAGVTDYLQKEAGTTQYDVLANRIRNAVERYRAQQAVEESERELRRVYERITDGFFAVNPDWKYVYVNEEGARLTEQSVEDLVGTTVWEAFPDLADSPFADALRTAMETGETATIEEYYPGLDAWFDVRVYGSEDGISIYFQDVTDHKTWEQEIKREQAYIEQALDTLTDMFYVIGAAGEIRRWNQRVVEVTGYTDTELDGMDVMALFPPDEHGVVADGIAEVFDTGNAIIQADIQTKDGTRITHEITGAQLTAADGETAGLVGIARNIDEGRERERKITALHDIASALDACEASDEVWALLIDAAEDVLDHDQANVDAAQGDYLVPQATSSETRPAAYYDRTAISADDNLGAESFRLGEPTRVDDLRTHDVNPADVSYRSVLSIPIGDHGLFQAVSDEPAMFDDTDQELAELLCRHAKNALDRIAQQHDLRRQNERLEEFASLVSHDLRNPLNVARGRLEFAQAECDSDHLEVVARAQDRMDALIADLLTLARTGSELGQRTPVNLPSVLERCWQTIDTGDAELHIETDRTVQADESRLQQVFENLFRNSVDHGGSGVSITVGDLPDGFYVADDGPGIPEEHRDEVFEAGYSTADEGTGFGLSIVHRVVTAHGWTIEVTESETGGARFDITGVQSA